MTASPNPKLEESALLILAAGNSSRMGAPKGLLLYEGKRLIESMVESYLSAGGRNVLIAIGKDGPLYREQNLQATIVQNNLVELGPLYSLQLLLKRTTATYCFITPVDLPAPPTFFWGKMLSAMSTEKRFVIPRYDNKGGHPILLRHDAKDKILNCDSQISRLDHIIKELPSSQVHHLDLDISSVTKNFNTPGEINNS